MTKLLIFFLLTAAPSISLAVSFDCSKAASLPEILICNDQELSKLDDELSTIYLRAKPKAPDQTVFTQQTRAAWKWRETNCKTKECLINWYAQRRGVLFNRLLIFSVEWIEAPKNPVNLALQPPKIA